MVYRIRVMAFNESGNGLPGEAEEIIMEEEGKLLLSYSTNDQGEKNTSLFCTKNLTNSCETGTGRK